MYAVMRMDLENIMLSDISQTHKEDKDDSTYTKYIEEANSETQCKIQATGLGERQEWGAITNEYRVYVGEDESLGVDSVMGTQDVNV